MPSVLGAMVSRIGKAARTMRYSRLLLGDRRGDVIRAHLEEVYRLTNRFLRDLGVDYWLIYGTLLGYYREGRLLPNDWDVDFGAHEREYPRIWAARHELPPSCQMHDTSYKHYGPKLYVIHEGWKADIYFYKDADGRLQSYEKSRNQGDMASFPRRFVYPLRAAVFLGEPTTVPHDPEAYLVHTYHYIGPDAVRDSKTGYWHQKAR